MTMTAHSAGMFENVQTAPPDPILGITDAFNKDTNPHKINLSVGVYQDENGKTPILGVVKEAEKRLLASETDKAYKPITGDGAYGKLVQELLFGAGHEVVASGRGATAHTPGGTGALRVAGDYLAKSHDKPTVWVSDPTWPNHAGVFQAAGLTVKTYPYFDPKGNNVAFDAMIDALGKVNRGEVVLLHGSCHNPSGADPTEAQWSKIGQVLADRGALPLVDFAYQGFAEGVEKDASGLRKLVEETRELIVCSSFSKNFGLYNERVGAMTVVTSSPAQVNAVMSQVKVVVRVNYSNPPAHGAAIVTTVLKDKDLRKQWEAEVAGMRDRINGMRRLFVDTLKRKGAERDFGFITHQRGMFSFSGLTKEQVETLKTKHAIYIVGSGRINVAGMTTSNMDPLCEAIVGVL